MMKSLMSADKNAKVYTLCMDDSCAEMLDELRIYNIVLIRLADFEDADLLRIKSTRSTGEYCWTCTAKLIKYVLDKYDEEMCTYVDADMRFYSDPTVLIEEMKNSKCTVQVIPHRFPPNRLGRKRELFSGRNCVQFNTFVKSDDQSMELLNLWIFQCLEECSVENIGDQKYTDGWSDLPFVNSSNNIGAGVAPWNISRFSLKNSENLIIYDKYSKTDAPLVFYHFQNLVFPSDNTVRISPYLEYWILDKRLVDIIYTGYLKELMAARLVLFHRFSFKPATATYITSEIKDSRSKSERIFEFVKAPLNDKLDRISLRCRIMIRKKRAFLNLDKLK